MSGLPGKSAIPEDKKDPISYDSYLSSIYAHASDCMKHVSCLKAAKMANGVIASIWFKEKVVGAQKAAESLQFLLDGIAATDHVTFMMTKLIALAPILKSISEKHLTQLQCDFLESSLDSLTLFLIQSRRYLVDLFDIDEPDRAS